MTEQLTLDVVLRQLQKDLLATDFRWSILVAAARSYRHDSVLRPFPPMLLRRTDHRSSSVTSTNGVLQIRDHAAMVSVRN